MRLSICVYYIFHLCILYTCLTLCTYGLVSGAGSMHQTVQLGGCTLCCYWSLISNEAVCWCWSCTVGNYQPIIAPYIITTHRSLAPDWSSPATRTNPALPLVGGNETKARSPPAAGPRWPQPGSCSSSLVWMEDGYHDPAPPLLLSSAPSYLDNVHCSCPLILRINLNSLTGNILLTLVLYSLHLLIFSKVDTFTE